jgi:glycosyltransferase involved in cell wall biosynthesis
MILDPALVVPVNDAPALAAAALAVAELPESERARLGAEAREHIVRQYGLERMSTLYARTYEALCKSGPR